MFAIIQQWQQLRFVSVYKLRRNLSVCCTTVDESLRTELLRGRKRQCVVPFHGLIYSMVHSLAPFLEFVNALSDYCGL